jgi:hypothetical protein
MPFGLLAIRIFLWLISLLAAYGLYQVVIDSVSISPSSTNPSERCLERTSRTPENPADVSQLSLSDRERLFQAICLENSSQSTMME